jgi:hypothetical protein
MRRCEREYYDQLIYEKKNNIKGTWKVLNSIIKRNQRGVKFPDYFVKEDGLMSGKTEIANSFNNFFCECWTKSSIKNKYPTKYISL